MKILLIEDDKNLCEMLCFQLESEHHEVEVCMDGRDGLDLFLQDAYDLVLLDRMLPTMNGLLVLQKARKAGISTPVIMITALGELYDRVEGLDCGADDYLVKPFAYEELSARIRSIGRRNHVYDDNDRFSYADISYDSRLRELCGPSCSPACGEVMPRWRKATSIPIFILCANVCNRSAATQPSKPCAASVTASPDKRSYHFSHV